LAKVLIKEIISMKKGVVWSFKGVTQAEAQKMADKLLYNKNYEQVEIKNG